MIGIRIREPVPASPSPGTMKSKNTLPDTFFENWKIDPTIASSLLARRNGSLKTEA